MLSWKREGEGEDERQKGKGRKEGDKIPRNEEKPTREERLEADDSGSCSSPPLPPRLRHRI